jgi:hypothetical protein
MYIYVYIYNPPLLSSMCMRFRTVAVRVHSFCFVSHSSQFTQSDEANARFTCVCVCVCVFARASGWMDGWMERERETERQRGSEVCE